VDCLCLDASQRPTWLRRVLEYLDLPLTPDQLSLFEGGGSEAG
jgi:hypothetical protein